MANWPATPNLDYLCLNQWEHWIKRAAGKAHDIGMDDPAEALVHLDAIAAYASEWRALVQRRAADRQNAIGRLECESSIPPCAS